MSVLAIRKTANQDPRHVPLRQNQARKPQQVRLVRRIRARGPEGRPAHRPPHRRRQDRGRAGRAPGARRDHQGRNPVRAAPLADRAGEARRSGHQGPKGEGSDRGLGRFVKLDGKARLELDETKIEAAARWDGLKGVVTNAPDMGHSKLFARYRELWRVEESFRITKHDLKVRPVFHWKPDRVKAHIAIAYMAFACVRHLACRIAQRQGERMSPERIRTALGARQCSIVRDLRSKRRYALPSQTTPDMDRISRTLGLPTSRAPYWIK